MAEDMMLSRINMAKSFYQLHNGQVTWLRSKQHHLRQEDVCRCIYSTCACSYLQFIYNLSARVCVWRGVHVCVPSEL